MTSEALPFISVIIPMRNEAERIGKCIESVLQQDYPADRMEILVVDGNSEDASREVIAAFADRDPRVRLLHNPRQITPTALNIGIRAARGDVIVRVDGHTALSPDYVREGVEALRRTGADNVGGPMITRGGGPIGDAVALAMGSRFGIGAYFHFGTDERFVDTVYMGMWPRDVFSRVGLFDEELVRNQDDEFNYRLRKMGGRILLVPRMRSSYQNRRDLKSLARQFYQYGLWKIRVCQKHPRQMSWRHFVPPALVLALLSWLPGTVLSARLALAGGAVVLLYAAAIGCASWQAAKRAGSRDVRWLPVVFAIIHVAWGLGFLVGLIRFAANWFRPEAAPPQLVSDRPGPHLSVD